jgi:hypothetical protein
VSISHEDREDHEGHEGRKRKFWGASDSGAAVHTAALVLRSSGMFQFSFTVSDAHNIFISSCFVMAIYHLFLFAIEMKKV